MYYSGYDQGNAGYQAYPGGFGNNMQDYNYQMQQMMPTQENGGYNGYEQHNAFAQQKVNNGMVGGAGHATVGGNGHTGYLESGGSVKSFRQQQNEDTSTNLKSSRSFTGPPPGNEHQPSFISRSRSIGARSGKGNDTGMARHGSVFFSVRERDTQMAISTRGGMSVRGLDEEENDLKQFYGDMATRHEERHMDGLKAIRSYRGDIEDGDDIGKPRRVTNRRNVDGRSATGYGGINFKRKVAMRNGEQWGEVEVRTVNGDGSDRREAPPSQRSGGNSYGMAPSGGQMYGAMPQSMGMAPGFYEAPAVPQIYSKQDVHSYSNMSDAFSGPPDGTDMLF